MNEIDTLLRTAARTGISPSDGEVARVLGRGSPVERVKAGRAIHAAAYELRSRQLDGDGCDEAVAELVDAVAGSLALVARPAVRSA